MRSPACRCNAFPQVTFAARAGQHLHADGVGDGELTAEGPIDGVARRRPGVAEECHPRRGVDDDHAVRPGGFGSTMRNAGHMMGSTQQGSNAVATVQSVERAIDLLEALARGPAGISDLGAATGLPKSTVSRLLATLEGRGVVARMPDDARYRLGDAVGELAGAVTPSRNLVGVARPHLVRLTEDIGEATGLSVADGYDVHYLDQVESPNPVQVRDWTGSRIPLHVVPSGMVLLAHWPAEARQLYLTRPLERFTEATVTDPAALDGRLAAVRREGWAWGREEFAAGINSVAAPVRDDTGAVVAAIHAHGPAYRFPAGAQADGIAAGAAAEAIAKQVAEAADHISARLGFPPPA